MVDIKFGDLTAYTVFGGLARVAKDIFFRSVLLKIV